MIISEEDAARFWARVDRSGGPDACWYPTIQRYGRIRHSFTPATINTQSGSYMSHKLAYILAYGELPSDMIIRHRCGNGNCCNPTHLRAGTHRENRLDDAARKRRGIPPGVLFTYEDEAMTEREQETKK